MRTLGFALALVAAALTGAHRPAGASPPPGGAAGGASPRAAPPVVGGEPAEAGRWNDAAAVFDGDVQVCSGTLVAPDLVVTAGHCVLESNPPSDVKLGATELAGAGETIEVSRALQHPDSSDTFDVGLLELAQPSSFTPRVLATGCVLDRYLENGAPVAIVGWGATDADGQQTSDVLMEGRSVITDQDCTGGRGCYPAVSPGGELTAGGDGVDSCPGDSGGPLYLLTDIGEFLVGITSRGFDDFDVVCGEGGIYVRPDAVLDWIEQESGRTLPRATCNERPAPTAEATALEVEAGDSIEVMVTPNDPDAGDSHVFGAATAPAHGQLEIEPDGTVRYTADADYGGVDAFAVDVADDGVPSLSAQLAFDVNVVPGDDGCGCRAAEDRGAPLLVALAALIPLARRRRRRR
jgi:MYXO-CTERM domain-containing protein